MSTPEMITKLRDMAAQILTPSSKGKHFFNEVADKLTALHAVSCPLDQLRDAYPVVLFFASKKDAAEFEQLVQEAQPGLKAYPLD